MRRLSQCWTWSWFTAVSAMMEVPLLHLQTLKTGRLVAFSKARSNRLQRAPEDKCGPAVDYRRETTTKELQSSERWQETPTSGQRPGQIQQQCISGWNAVFPPAETVHQLVHWLLCFSDVFKSRSSVFRAVNDAMAAAGKDWRQWRNNTIWFANVGVFPETDEI